MKKKVKYTLIVIGIITVIYFIVASFGPETSVVAGNQIPKRFYNNIRKKNLIEKDDKIILFSCAEMIPRVFSK